MTPRTRSTNKDANYKVYYSKKVPQQIHFPHRRKIVRRPLPKDASDKKQMRFLPDKMRVRRDVVDLEEEVDEEDMEGGGVVIGSEAEEEVEEETGSGKSTKARGQKRRREAADTEEEDEGEPVEPIPKRRRQAAAPKSTRRSKPADRNSDDKDDAAPNNTRREVDRSRTLRRQSTMTQLVEGRRPLSDTEEPAFKPVKRSPRVSWGGSGKKAKDKKQRTLTQMVAGMTPLEIESDEEVQQQPHDEEAEERESQAYGEAIAARLAQEGLIQEKSDGVEEAAHSADQEPRATSPRDSRIEDDGKDLPAESADAPLLVVHSVEDDTEDEESYQPTQYIDAPVTRTRASPRRTSAVRPQRPQPTDTPPSTTRSKAKSKFGLLSTPEKRRVREIPSSQSPAETPLSTQVSSSKAHRSPLQERSSNVTQAAETPSKRKQVTFSLPAQEPVPPPTLRKFKSTIQDSEDEEDDLIEADENDGGRGVGAHTQTLIQNMDAIPHGRDVGYETQAMLDQIDEACNADEQNRSRESSEELGVSIFDRVQSSPEQLGVSIFDRAESSPEELGVSIFDRAYESSPELGEPAKPRNARPLEASAEIHSSYHTSYLGVKQEPSHEESAPQQTVEGDAHSNYHASHVGVKQEQFQEANLDDESLVEAEADPESDNAELPVTTQVPSSPPILQPVEDTCPSTPLVIMDSSDEEDEPNPTPPPPQSSRTISQPSLNVLQQHTIPDASAVQVPRSPTLQQESQRSHSSKAEQQIQNQWFSYSQYVKARPAQSSSMHVAHDKFSYDATPKPPRGTGFLMSQATTVDEVTPRKNRTQHTSANTTPRKIASSQPFSSPSKPPPLIIPSSFPSPAKARMLMDGWSSPVAGRTQEWGNGGSLEDFSIPPPPPVEEDE
jgi:hypothetical protein